MCIFVVVQYKEAIVDISVLHFMLVMCWINFQTKNHNNNKNLQTGNSGPLVQMCDSGVPIPYPGYFLPTLGLFWDISVYLRLNSGYLPPMHRHVLSTSGSDRHTHRQTHTYRQTHASMPGRVKILSSPINQGMGVQYQVTSENAGLSLMSSHKLHYVGIFGYLGP